MKLIFPKGIYEQIKEVVLASSVETGVTLFGQKEGEEFTIKGIAGPGPEATHEEFHYSGNEDYATDVFEELKKTNPDLKHIGELHVHPIPLRSLSGGDRETVREILNNYEEFIAGVMLRHWLLGFYVFPVYFSREFPKGIPMEVELEF
jgi:hypothetical protein